MSDVGFNFAQHFQNLKERPAQARELPPIKCPRCGDSGLVPYQRLALDLYMKYEYVAACTCSAGERHNEGIGDKWRLPRIDTVLGEVVKPWRSTRSSSWESYRD